jgi:hypothetical protein
MLLLTLYLMTCSRIYQQTVGLVEATGILLSFITCAIHSLGGGALVILG